MNYSYYKKYLKYKSKYHKLSSVGGAKGAKQIITNSIRQNIAIDQDIYLLNVEQLLQYNINYGKGFKLTILGEKHNAKYCTSFEEEYSTNINSWSLISTIYENTNSHLFLEAFEEKMEEHIPISNLKIDSRYLEILKSKLIDKKAIVKYLDNSPTTIDKYGIYKYYILDLTTDTAFELNPAIHMNITYKKVLEIDATKILQTDLRAQLFSDKTLNEFYSGNMKFGSLQEFNNYAETNLDFGVNNFYNTINFIFENVREKYYMNSFILILLSEFIRYYSELRNILYYIRYSFEENKYYIIHELSKIQSIYESVQNNNFVKLLDTLNNNELNSNVNHITFMYFNLIALVNDFVMILSLFFEYDIKDLIQYFRNVGQYTSGEALSYTYFNVVLKSDFSNIILYVGQSHLCHFKYLLDIVKEQTGSKIIKMFDEKGIQKDCNELLLFNNEYAEFDIKNNAIKMSFINLKNIQFN